MTPIRRWLAVTVVLLAACRDGTVAPSLNKSSTSANVDVGVQAGDLDVNPHWNSQDISSMQLTACGWTTRARLAGTSTVATQFWFCHVPTFTNLNPGEYEVNLSFGPNSNVPMADPASATVTVGTTFILDLETSAYVGKVTGVVTMNGVNASNLTACAVTGQTAGQQMQQCGTIGSFQNGRFTFLVPAGAGTIELRSQNGGVIHSESFNVGAGDAADVGTIAVSLGDLHVKPQYQGQDLHLLGLTACGATVRARHVPTNVTSTQFWFCFMPTLTNVATGTYEVSTTFGPNSNVMMAPLKTASVIEGTLTTLDVETSGHVGMVSGLVTENGVPTTQMTVCAMTGSGITAMQQCGTVTQFANGRFTFLVPAGDGRIELQSQNGQVILTHPFTASTNASQDLGTLNVAVGDLAVKALYEGVDVATMQLTACGITARARYLPTNAETTQFWFCSLPPFANLTPGNYEVRLGFGPNFNVSMAPPTPASVVAGTTTNLGIEMSEHLGLLTGTVTRNGQPATDLVVCAETGRAGTPTHMSQCGSVSSFNAGRFKFLVPPGCGSGTVRGFSGNTLANFTFCLEQAGEEEDVGNPVEPSDTTAPVVTPTLTGTLGSGGWYTSDVSVSWSVTDAESNVTSPACAPSSVTANTSASGVTFSCTATSAGGTATKSVTVRRDASGPAIAPTVTGTLGSNGWYTSDVEVSWAASDAESGIASSSGCSLGSVLADVTGASFACTATNGAGLSGTESVSVKRDATAPTVSFSGNGGSYTVDQTVSITCTASDATSQLAASTCPSLSTPAYELPLGPSILTATAIDGAGNRTEATARFSVEATPAAVCALVERWVVNQGVANSLCVKLRNGSFKAFQNELSAQTGKHIPGDKATILSTLSEALQ